MPLELKSTLNLPRTGFAMKANLPKNEPRMLERWQHMGLYERLREAHRGQPIYVMHDGPPYANGPIHLGTAFNKTLKDFVVKSRSMSGFDAPYVPGWDCHGLPIEIKIDDQLGRRKLDMDPLAVREECRKYAARYLDLQREQFRRLGVLGRWERPYSTMDPEYESVVLESFYTCYERGLVYNGLKSVYWCIHDKTALAEAEVEYEMHTSPGIWVRYPLTSDPGKLDGKLAGRKKVATIIWTTTPWTLPASMAVTFAPDAEYVALDTGEWIYMVAKALAQQTIEKCGLREAKEIASFPGTKLEHATFAHPFLERSVLGVLGDYVTMDTGTGAVHTAPAHGADDFNTGVKYGLDLRCDVDDAGILRSGLPEYRGQQVFRANPLIVDLLKSRGVLLGYEEIEHSYPHCWRCHNSIIFRATEQWFIAMEGTLPGGGTLRTRALEAIRKVKWDPGWGEERITNMVAGRPDWCVSRQRVWGVPIALFQCEDCKEFLKDPAVNRRVVELFAREGGDAWYRRSPEEIVPAGARCAKCGGTKLRKEMDIVDVWFESGSSHAAVLGREPGLPWPADLYLEGGDQHRGWFQSSLLCAVATRGEAPYRRAATAGWTLDPQGRAMSKSLGNTVDPVEIADKMGAEIVRLWVASVDFREDVMASDELMQRVAESYRKIRNTFRYILGNLDGFEPQRDGVTFAQMHPLDQYILLRAAEVTRDVREHYDTFVFHRLYQRLKDFCIVDLSAIYFDVLKDRLYTSAPKSPARRSAQTALWRLGEALVRLLAPVMSFTADEIWQHLPAVEGRRESVHLELFPAPEELTGAVPAGFDVAGMEADWQTLLSVRDQTLKALETARNAKRIGSGLEAQVHLGAPESIYPVLERYRDQLRYLFIVSDVVLEKLPASDGAGLAIEIRNAPGEKCERCWNYSTRVGEDSAYPTVCERCSAVLAEIEAAARAS
ncbi:MAG TPA: isoleucine--tRNA ligase [Candidatus Binatia bacterium]|nr:isoleucine--tRNA ligase [Candidatus Binatia bacterium]